METPALEETRRTANEKLQLRAGQRVGPYQLVALLGAGGMGQVWRAWDPALNRHVAIKTLSSLWSGDTEYLQRFEQEARAAGMLNHPNVLAVYAVGTEGGTPYLVTELLEGATVRQRLASGPIPQSKAIDYACQVAQGLAAAHEKGLTHRDIKPENIFVTKDGCAKILDFGLAKLVKPGPEVPEQLQTTAGKIAGTPAYMSPEQLRGRAADHRSDIFGLGLVLYETLAGQRAFSGQTSVETMNAILTEEAPPIPQVPRVVNRILRHCLEKEPAERFQSARDLAFQLRLASESSGSP